MTGKHAISDRQIALSIEQAGEVLGISRAAVYKALARGDLPSLRVGGRRLIPRSAVQALVEKANAEAAV